MESSKLPREEMKQAFIAESLSMSQQYFIVYSKLVKVDFKCLDIKILMKGTGGYFNMV